MTFARTGPTWPVPPHLPGSSDSGVQPRNNGESALMELIGGQVSPFAAPAYRSLFACNRLDSLRLGACSKDGSIEVLVKCL